MTGSMTTVRPSPDTPPPIPLTAQPEVLLASVADCYLETRPLEALAVLHPRLMETPDADAELLGSLKFNGQLSAIDTALDGTVLNGSRRKRLMLVAGFTHALCRVHPGIVTDEQKQKAIHGFDVQQKRSLLERGLKYDAHIAATGCSQQDAAAYYGCPPCDITRGLRQARCSPETRADLAARRLTADHLNAVARVKDDARREALLRQAAAEGVKPKELAKLAAGKPRRKQTAVKMHTVADVPGYVASWNASWTLPELLAANEAFVALVKNRVRSADKKAMELPRLLETAVVS